jgi:GNAT superfamily N-acetyltransferase
MEEFQQYEFTLANKSEMQRLSELASEIWPITFSKILSTAQIDYMLNWMYAPEKLINQLDEGHTFFFLRNKNVEIGFCGLEENYPESGLMRIHKIYLKPEFHGMGLGKFMLEKIEELARSKNLKGLHLNVNRFNNAVQFYEKAGFETIKTEDIDIGNGFLMEDFVMQKIF